MRIHGVGAQYGRNLCPQNLRNNQVSFGKIDEDIKDEVYAMAERSPHKKGRCSNKGLIEHYDKQKNVHIYKNPDSAQIDFSYFIPKSLQNIAAAKWFKSKEYEECRHDIDMEKLRTIELHIDSVEDDDFLQECAESLQEYNDAVDADRYYNSDS